MTASLRRSGPAALCVLLASTVMALAGPQSTGYERLKVLGVWTHVVTVNMNDPQVKVTVEVAVGFPGSAEPLSAFIRRTQPAAAVTGTFFSKVSLLPVGAIVIDGRQRYFGGLGSAVAITPDNRVSFRRVPYGRHVDWSEYETVLGCGPTLLKGGRVDVNPRAEGFSDPRVLGRAPRTAIGLTDTNKLKLIAVGQDITLTECAKILRALGCVEAINLDGGSSSALYFWGKTILAPGRPLVNLLVVHERVPQESRFARALPEQKAKYRERKRRERGAEHFAAAEALRQRGKTQGAIDEYKRAVEADPDNASYHVAFATMLQEAGRRRDAASELTAAGQAQLANGLLTQARTSLANAIALNPLHASAHRALAQVYSAQGLIAQSKEALRLAESVELALATIGGAPSDIHDAYAAQGRPSSGPAFSTYRRPLQGTVAGLKFTSKQAKFALAIPSGWRFMSVDDPAELNVQHESKTMRAVLRIFPTSSRTAPKAFADMYFAGTFREQLDATHLVLNGCPAYEVHAREIVGDALIESVTTFVLRGSDMFVLTRVARSEQFFSAKPDFAYLRTHLEFLD
jgi:tetratricopeptide (TPR) repeat protein